MTDTQTNPTAEAPADNGPITITTKSKVDGKTVERSAKYQPQVATNLLAQLNSDNEDLVAQVVECYELGATGRLRNHINAGRTDSRGVITPTDLLEMTAEAAANRATTSEGLALFREAVGLVIKVAEASGISAGGCAKIRKLIQSPVGLSMASDAHKAKVAQLLEATSAALPDADLERLSSPLTKMLEATQATDEEDDWL